MGNKPFFFNGHFPGMILTNKIFFQDYLLTLQLSDIVQKLKPNAKVDIINQHSCYWFSVNHVTNP